MMFEFINENGAGVCLRKRQRLKQSGRPVSNQLTCVSK
jgi:hypothetical protein